MAMEHAEAYIERWWDGMTAEQRRRALGLVTGRVWYPTDLTLPYRLVATVGPYQRREIESAWLTAGSLVIPAY